MGRAVNLSPLGLYEWDNHIFDLMTIPTALDRDVLIQNLLAETAELEVLYPNPVIFKNLVGVWSHKNIDVWNKLYSTTQYEYNPIENYNRYETGTDDSSGSTTHSGTDTRTEAITHGGADTTDMTRRQGGTESREINTDVEEGGTEREAGTYSIDNSGSDVVEGTDKKGHWISGFDSPTPTQADDGLLKQTRDEDEAETTTTYGKEEDGTSSNTTTFGKTVDTDATDTTTFGKTETNQDRTTYGKTENVTESTAHGETIRTTNEGEHDLHAHGNIGVTTTQKLIREEREIDLFNMYDIIIEDFKMKFCILVY